MTAADIAARYRVYAAHCVESAKATSEFTSKLVLLEMARAWLDLADQAEKNGENRHLYETPALNRPASSIPFVM